MCGKYVHIVSDCWCNNNRNHNRNNNKTARNPHINRECNNCGKRGHRAVDGWTNKVKDKDDDVDNLFVGDTLCGEVQEENNEEDPK